MSESHDRPTVSQPLHGPKRNYLSSAIIVLGILALIALIFAVITYARYNS